jgi:hypothetical protein
VPLSGLRFRPAFVRIERRFFPVRVNILLDLVMWDRKHFLHRALKPRERFRAFHHIRFGFRSHLLVHDGTIPDSRSGLL